MARLIGFRERLWSELIGRIAGEVGDHTVRIIQIEHLKDGIVRGPVLALDDGIVHAAFLDCHVVLEHRLTVQTNPGIAGGLDFSCMRE